VPVGDEVDQELALHVETRRREGKPLDAEMQRVHRARLAIAKGKDRQAGACLTAVALRADC
jgi:hypothetical protein